MIHSGEQLRFTSTEVEHFQKIGIDLHDVKSRSDLGNTLLPWLSGLAEVRPDLLEQLVRRAADAKGMRIPPRLTVITDLA